jgi:hypothetical protein
MKPRKTVRAHVIEMFRAAFGEPEVTTVKSGDIFRWTLSRGRKAMPMFITVDSPEFPHLAHILISDGSAHQVEPVVALRMYTRGEAEAVIRGITRQWKSMKRKGSK